MPDSAILGVPHKTMKTDVRLFLMAGLLTVAFVRMAAAATKPMKPELLTDYVKIADVLASDDLAAAKSAAAALSVHADIADQFQIAKQATAVAKATDLAVAREGFKVLSYSIEPLAAGEKGYVVMTCTMVNADWVQTATEVRNPYLGKAMPTCGAPKQSAPSPHRIVAA